MKRLLALFLLALAQCATPANDESQSHPHPMEWARRSGRSDLETVVIAGTNDIHGALAPLQLKTREAEGVAPIEYEAAGAAMLSGYLNALREEFGEHFLWLDAGDEFQGTLESNSQLGAPMVTFFNAHGLHAAAVGNHEFDFGVKVLTTRMSEAHYPYLAANIALKSTHLPPGWPNTLPHTLLHAGKLKIGVIGLSTIETPTTTRPENVSELEFTDLAKATLKSAKELRAAGAHVVVAVGHVGIRCDAGKAGMGLRVRRKDDVQGECGGNDEVVKVLHALPAGTLDAFVAGHSHQVVHHWVGGIPVIQAGVSGRFLNLIYLTYDWTQMKLLTDQAAIEGPIPVCRRIFRNQGDCLGDRPAPERGRGPLVPPKLHGREILPDASTATLLDPVFRQTEAIKAEVIANAARPVEHDRSKESQLGNLVADAFRWKTGADVALINGGGIRAPWESGPLTYGAVFRTLPFDNNVLMMNVTGAELRNILRLAFSGAKGLFSVSGARLRLIRADADAPSDDLDHNGKIEPWEVNRLIEIQVGTPLKKLDPKKKYRLATIDFLVSGGDGMGWAMNQVPKDRIDLHGAPLMRDAVVEYVKNLKVINPATDPLVKPGQPRLSLENPPPKSRRRGRR